MVGTAGYLAPEQAEGAAVTPAADVYALGLVLLEALTGERAYRGTPLERAVANALKPPTIPARLGAGWLAVLRALTARDPAARPPAERVPELLARAEDEPPRVGALDETMELTPVLAEAPDHPVPALTVAAPDDGAVGRSGSGTPGSAASCAGTGSASTPRLRPVPAHRRLATVGAAALAATAFLGIGAGTHWLSTGAGAAPADPSRQPPPASPTPAAAPGAGAAAAPQNPAATPAPAAARTVFPASPTSAGPGTSALPASDAQRPADQVLSGPAKCRPGGDGGDGGHEKEPDKHKCP